MCSVLLQALRKMWILVYFSITIISCFAHDQAVVISNKDINIMDVAMFKKWVIHHNQRYRNVEEEQLRLRNFASNLHEVHAHNRNQQRTWNMELNKFSDMTFEEFQSRYLMQLQNCSATSGKHVISNQPLPEHKDWRDEGKYVTPVKNQKACGSCWTFSTSGCLESATAIHKEGHPLYSLSEQQLVDCAQMFDNHGCNGGLPSQAFEYIHYNNGLMSESAYPYTGKDGKCKFDPALAKAFVKDVVNITQGDEDQMVDAVAFLNPVSVAFEVTKDFMNYKSGIYTSSTCGSRPDQVNHAVLAVGYGTDHNTGMKYWIIKNSWGEDWGLNGYFHMQRGKNMCGIATCASYPVV